MIAHKLWKTVSSLLLLALTIHCVLKGFFREKALLPNRTNGTKVNSQEPNDRKVIMLLVDALREDFVAFDEPSKHFRYIDEEGPETYKGP